MYNVPSENLIQQYAATVENLLNSVGINPASARLATDSGFGWTFQFGSAIIEIYIVEEGGFGYLKVMSPIIHLPPGGLLPLYRRLLELNLNMTNASLGVYQDVVWVFNERPLDGLDNEEARGIIDKVTEYADYLDNVLVNEFGGRLYSTASV